VEAEPDNEGYAKVEGASADNWVWSPQGLIQMHLPEQWGFVRFSTAAVGAEAPGAAFELPPEEEGQATAEGDLLPPARVQAGDWALHRQPGLSRCGAPADAQLHVAARTGGDPIPVRGVGGRGGGPARGRPDQPLGNPSGLEDLEGCGAPPSRTGRVGRHRGPAFERMAQADWLRQIGSGRWLAPALLPGVQDDHERRHVGRRHAGDARGLSQGPRTNVAEFLPRLDR